jgi:hypothetical protein
VPARYGSWSTIYDQFRMWATGGVFARVMEAMIAEAARRGQVDLSLVSVDSTVARAHQHAAGMTVDPELLAALEQAVAAEKGAGKRNKTSARPGQPLRQDRRKLPRRTPPPRRHPVAAQPPTHYMITSQNGP